MPNPQITVSKWTDEDDDPADTTYEQLADGTWNDVSNPSNPPLTLSEVMFVGLNEALCVTTAGDQPSPAELAAALPRSSDYLQRVPEIETGNEVLDFAIEPGVVPVAINDRWWVARPVSGAADGMSWLECEPDGNNKPYPVGRVIASASGIENGSMTSGLSFWSLLDVGGDMVCFATDLDEGEDEVSIETRNGRTDLELAYQFGNWIEWEPVSLAVFEAISAGGSFDGTEAELNEDGSTTCEVEAWVDLR